ncbi:MAG: hypothetical protein MHMPM18_004789 [Marteilia pararefringens]
MLKFFRAKKLLENPSIFRCLLIHSKILSKINEILVDDDVNDIFSEDEKNEISGNFAVNDLQQHQQQQLRSHLQPNEYQ